MSVSRPRARRSQLPLHCTPAPQAQGQPLVPRSSVDNEVVQTAVAVTLRHCEQTYVAAVARAAARACAARGAPSGCMVCQRCRRNQRAPQCPMAAAVGLARRHAVVGLLEHDRRMLKPCLLRCSADVEPVHVGSSSSSSIGAGSWAHPPHRHWWQQRRRGVLPNAFSTA